MSKQPRIVGWKDPGDHTGYGVTTPVFAGDPEHLAAIKAAKSAPRGTDFGPSYYSDGAPVRPGTIGGGCNMIVVIGLLGLALGVRLVC